MDAVPEQRSLAVLFADVRGSTRLYEELGDVRGRERVAASVDAFRAAVEDAGGAVVKTLGDGAMATCPTPEAAVVAATATQAALAGGEAAVGIGLHFGPVLVEEDDVFGDAVNVAARLCGLAKAGEVLTTEETVQGLPQFMRSATRALDALEVKGRREPVAVRQLLWDSTASANMTVVAGAPPPRAARAGERVLTLGAGDAVCRLTSASDALDLGRMHGGLVVPDSRASRLHARVESSRGRFILTDLSTNGTYVAFDRGSETVLRRESTELDGAGWIGLGRPATPDNDCRVRFAVEGDGGADSPRPPPLPVKGSP